jgi:Effector Associated Constant Component 1
VELRLVTDGDQQAMALSDWLHGERELRGLVRRRPAPPSPGMMSAGTDLVLQLGVPVAAGVLGAVAQALTAFLLQRSRDVPERLTVEIVGAGVRRITVAKGTDAAALTVELTKLADDDRPRR